MSKSSVLGEYECLIHGLPGYPTASVWELRQGDRYKRVYGWPSTQDQIEFNALGRMVNTDTYQGDNY